VDPTAWKRPTQHSDDIRDDYRRMLQQARRDMTLSDLTEHGVGFTKGVFQGVWAVVRLTLSEDEATALLED